MKKVISAFSFLFVFAFISCSDTAKKAEDKKEAAVQEAQKEVEELQKEYDLFKKDMRQKLEANEQKMSDLKEQANALTGEAKRELDRSIDSLETRNKEIRNKLEEKGDKVYENWEDFKKEMESDLDGLADAFKNFGRKNE